MNDLERYFRSNPGNLINKWSHYFEIYDRHLSRYRDTDVHLLEIGVRHGGSLQMWKHYFGDRAKIYGVDIHPRSGELAEDQIEIFIGDQEDKAFLASLAAQLPRIDVLIDDGGHTMPQQLNTFEVLFPEISPDGVYICEDTHTSFSKTFGGGFRDKGSFLETSKGLIDDLHGYHKRGRNPDFEVTDYTRSLDSVHFYDCMVLIEKEARDKPEMVYTGEPQF
jgi:hypothetical protein